MHGLVNVRVGCLLVVARAYGRLSHARGPLPIGLRGFTPRQRPSRSTTNKQPTHTLNQPYIQSSIQPSVRSLTRTSIHPPIHSPTHPFTHSSIHPHPFIHPPIHPPIPIHPNNPPSPSTIHPST